MSADDRNQELDLLLDTALQNYSCVEPPPGLEPRILAALEAAARRAPHLVWSGWSGWMLPAGAVAVAFAALLYVSLRSPVPLPAPPAQVAETAPAAPPAPAPVAPAVSTPATRPNRPVVERSLQAAALPRRERFPAPAPLSEQEQLILRYLEVGPSAPLPPAEGPDAFTALTVEPLQFPPLKIEKLERNP